MSAADIAELRSDLADMKAQVAVCCEQIKHLRLLVIVVGLLSAGGAQAIPILEKLIAG